VLQRKTAEAERLAFDGGEDKLLLEAGAMRRGGEEHLLIRAGGSVHALSGAARRKDRVKQRSCLAMPCRRRVSGGWRMDSRRGDGREKGEIWGRDWAWRGEIGLRDRRRSSGEI
jgi:hypothetical protein